MKKIITIFHFTVFILAFVFSQTAFTQTVIFTENFESGTANPAWGVFYPGEDNVVARPMSQAPKPLATGGSFVGWLQDIDGSYTGSAVAVTGSVGLKDYSIEADVYCYVNLSLSAYTGLVVYADSTRPQRDFYKMRVDFDVSNRINFSGLKSDPNTFLPIFNVNFLGTTYPGGYPTTDGWHKMKVEVRTISPTKVAFWCYFNGQLLVGGPIYDTVATVSSGRFGLYSFMQSATGLAAYFDNIVVTQLTTAVEDNIIFPTDFILNQNFPNPFNPETQISYKLSAGGFISLTVHDLLGRKIKTLVSEEQPSGSYTVVWNGKDELENTVSAGVYLYTLKAGNFVESKKMILMK